MKNYFKLYSTTYFVHSENEGCLYNTLNGNVVALSKEQKDLLILTEKGDSLDKLNLLQFSFYDALLKNMLGDYMDNPLVIEPTFWGENFYFDKIASNKKNIPICQIELIRECNYNCVFCNKDSDLVYRRTGCKRWKPNKSNRELKKNEWNKYIKEMALLGCKQVQVFGGEPFLVWETLRKIIETCHDAGIKEIEVYTNGSLLSSDILQFIKENNVKLVIQISNMSDNKKILGIKKDEDYDSILKRLKDKNIIFEVLLLVSKYNEKYIEEYTKMFKLHDYKYRMDFIYPFPDNDHFSSIYESYILDYKRKLVKINAMNLGMLKLRNPCYSKILAISVYGDVYPCILSRFTSYGKLNGNNSLASMLDDKFETLQNLNKDKMYSCKECVYRYACINCSAIEISACQGLFSCKNCSLIQER